MANLPPEKRKEYTSRRQMNLTWNSFEWLLREKIDQLDHLMYQMYREARGFGVTEQHYREFVRENMYQMINEVAQKREEETRHGRAGGKAERI